MQLLVTNYLKPNSMSTETKKVATVMYNYNIIFIISFTNNLELKEKKLQRDFLNWPKLKLVSLTVSQLSSLVRKFSKALFAPSKS